MHLSGCNVTGMMFHTDNFQYGLFQVCVNYADSSTSIFRCQWTRSPFFLLAWAYDQFPYCRLVLAPHGRPNLSVGAIAVFWSELGQKPVTPAMIRLFKNLVPFGRALNSCLCIHAYTYYMCILYISLFFFREVLGSDLLDASPIPSTTCFSGCSGQIYISLALFESRLIISTLTSEHICTYLNMIDL